MRLLMWLQPEDLCSCGASVRAHGPRHGVCAAAERTRYRLRTLTDTLYRTRTDTVLQKERETAAAAPSNNKNSHLVWWLLVVSVVAFAAKRLIARYRKR